MNFPPWPDLEIWWRPWRPSTGWRSGCRVRRTSTFSTFLFPSSSRLTQALASPPVLALLGRSPLVDALGFMRICLFLLISFPTVAGLVDPVEATEAIHKMAVWPPSPTHLHLLNFPLPLLLMAHSSSSLSADTSTSRSIPFGRCSMIYASRALRSMQIVLYDACRLHVSRAL